MLQKRDVQHPPNMWQFVTIVTDCKRIMSIDNLPSELKLNILEYGANPSISVSTDELMERIEIVNPLFSLGDVLQDKKRDLNDKIYAMSLYSWDLYNILFRYNALNTEYSAEDIFIIDVVSQEMNDEIMDIYPYP